MADETSPDNTSAESLLTRILADSTPVPADTLHEMSDEALLAFCSLLSAEIPSTADLHPDLRIDLVKYAMAKIEMALGASPSTRD